MKFFCSILLVAVSHAFVLNRITNESLAAPYVKNFTTLYTPPGFFMQWNTVLSSDSNDPVLGYKVNLWRYPGEKITSTEIIGNERIITISYEYPSFPGLTALPGPIWKVVSVPSSKRELKFDNLEYNVLYIIRVQAYTKKGDGPWSSPSSLTIEGPDEIDS